MTVPNLSNGDRQLLAELARGAEMTFRNAEALLDEASMGMRPDLSPEKREIVRQLERSARAEMKLRKKALDYQLNLERSRAAKKSPAAPARRAG